MDRALSADCARCFGLCCVAPAFAKSSDFAVTKPAGKACVNLGDGFACGIHDRLRDTGFPGCVVYDCFGAGQRIAQVTFGGVSWRDTPDRAPQMFAAYAVMRDLHELLFYLTQAAEFPAASLMQAQIGKALADVRRLADGDAAELTTLDTDAVRRDVNPLLLRASELQRRRLAVGAQDYRGANLIGAKLAGIDLRGASLRGACLIAADMQGTNLELADVIGADFRGADLRGADLSAALFLTQSQLEAARGDARTRLPAALRRPGHW